MATAGDVIASSGLAGVGTSGMDEAGITEDTIMVGTTDIGADMVSIVKNIVAATTTADGGVMNTRVASATAVVTAGNMVATDAMTAECSQSTIRAA